MAIPYDVFCACTVVFSGACLDPLSGRNKRLPRANVHARILYHDHIDGHGVALFEAVRGKDLEGVVAKWKHGRYHIDGQTTS